MTRQYVDNGIKSAVGSACVNCGATKDLAYHHIVPLAVGGNDIPSNMVCFCGQCHSLIHYGKKGAVNHSELVSIGIRRAQANGTRFGPPPADYKRVMRLIAEYSTQFNPDSLTTEAEIMEMAGVKNVCYHKCKRMLFEAMNADVWELDFEKPTPCRSHPMYEHLIKKIRMSEDREGWIDAQTREGRRH